MCGQEGRLPCQRLGSDRDTTITRPTLHLLIPDCKQRPEFILITKTLFLVCSLYNFVWPKKENYLASAASGIVQSPSDYMLCPVVVRLTLRIHISWKILRNIPSAMNLPSQHIVSFLCCSSFVITKDIPKNTNLFFPKQSYSSTLICSQLPSCSLMTSRWVSGVFFSEVKMM